VADNKYDNLVVSGPLPGQTQGSGTNIAWIDNNPMFKGSNQYHVHWVYETPRNLPGMKTWDDMSHGPHEHKSPEAVIHIGTNPDDPMDLGGEVWFYLGAEAEKHVINKACLVYLPADFIHSPWVIKKVTRPFVIVTVMQEEVHTEKSHPEIISKEENAKMMYIDQGYKTMERVFTTPQGLKNW
jgi:hypothetical protein